MQLWKLHASGIFLRGNAGVTQVQNVFEIWPHKFCDLSGNHVCMHIAQRRGRRRERWFEGGKTEGENEAPSFNFSIAC